MSALPPKADICVGPAGNALSWISEEHSSAQHDAAFKPRIYRATAASTVASP